MRTSAELYQKVTFVGQCTLLFLNSGVSLYQQHFGQREDQTFLCTQRIWYSNWKIQEFHSSIRLSFLIFLLCSSTNGSKELHTVLPKPEIKQQPSLYTSHLQMKMGYSFMELISKLEQIMNYKFSSHKRLAAFKSKYRTTCFDHNINHICSASPRSASKHLVNVCIHLSAVTNLSPSALLKFEFGRANSTPLR